MVLVVQMLLVVLPPGKKGGSDSKWDALPVPKERVRPDQIVSPPASPNAWIKYDVARTVDNFLKQSGLATLFSWNNA